MRRRIATQLSLAKEIVVFAAGAAQATEPIPAQQQPAENKVAFEVATIKRAAPNATPKNQMVNVSPNRISIPSMTLSWLIYTAYAEGMNTSVSVVGGPDWRNQTAYAIEAQSQEAATQVEFQATAHAPGGSLHVEDSQRSRRG